MKINKAIGLKAKLIMGTIAIIVVVTLGSMAVSYFQTYIILQDSIEHNAKNSTQQNAEIISNWLMSASREIDALSGASAMRGMNWDEQEPMLTGVIEDHPDYETLFVADRNGVANTTSGDVTNIANREYFKHALTKEEVSFSDPILSSLTGTPVFVVARPIIGYDGVSVAGVLGATVKLDYIWDLVERTTINGHGYGWVIDSQQSTVAHPDKQFIGNDLLLQNNVQLQEIAAKMVVGNYDLASYVKDGESITVAYAPIPITGWSMATIAKTNDLFAGLSVIRKSFVTLIVIALIIGVVLSYIFAHYFTKPIETLKDNAELVASGDLRQVVTMERKDEVGVLASAFTRMVQAIQSLIKAINASGNQVEKYSLELSSSMEENSASISEIANTAIELANVVETMNSQSQEMLATTSEISTMVVDGEAALEATVDQTSDLKEDIQRLSNVIDRLSRHSEQVQNVVQTIAGIAEQTNLLALNASIEAARAGEHGRGFSVVAEEIRQLSDESKLATTNIASSMLAIQEDIKMAVEGIESGILKTNDTVKIVSQSTTTLQAILSSITKITQGLEDTLNNVGMVGEGSQQMAAMTEEQSAIVEHLSAASYELSKMSQDLLGLIEEFKTQD